MNANGLKTYPMGNPGKSRRLLTGLIMIALVGLFLSACGAGSSTDDSARPGSNESSITGEARATSQPPIAPPTPEKTPTQTPTLAPTEIPTLEPTIEPTIDPEIQLELDLAKKADEAIRWTEVEKIPEIEYENLDQYMKLLVAKERAVDWDALGRRHRLSYANNSTAVGKPSFTRIVVGPNNTEEFVFSDTDPTELENNPIASITSIKLDNGETAYLLGVPVYMSPEKDKKVSVANIHMLVSDDATMNWLNEFVGNAEDIEKYKKGLMVESIVKMFKEGKFASLHLHVYNGISTSDESYQMMVAKRGMEELFQESVDKKLNDLLLKYFWYGAEMTLEERNELENIIMVLGTINVSFGD